jgi:cytochrome c oxidase assembly protein subunit 15
MVLQGAIGYTQYFLRVPAGVVEVHIVGVTALWIVAQRFYLGLFARPVPIPAEDLPPVIADSPPVSGYAATPS